MTEQPERAEDGARERDRLRARVAELEARCRRLEAARTATAEDRHLRDVVKDAPVVLWSIDRQGLFTLSEGKGLAKLGLAPGEVVGHSVFHLYAAEPEILASVREALQGRSRADTVRVGNLVFDSRYEPLPGPDGEVAGVLGLAIDITERTQIETRLKAREAELESLVLKQKRLLEQGWDVILMVDGSGRITFVSESSEHVLGYRPEEAFGRPVADFVPDADAGLVKEAIQGIIDRPVGPGTIEVRVRHRDGSLRWMEVRGTNFLADETMGAIVLNCRDITERKGTEEELVRLERLRALGELSAGVSHNLNNILTGVLAPAEMLKMRTRDADDLRDIQDILSSATRARDLISRLHKAVRPEAEAFLPVDLNAGIREAVRVARPRWRDEPEARGLTVEVAMELGPDVQIRGTHSGLQDILINLLFNAVDAMPEGGRIRIATERTPDGARLVVEDTGIGMTPEVRRRIFEPFFTTKSGVGTGLGLSTVFGTVGRWGGSVAVDSEPGQGARFTFGLKAWEGPPPDEADAQPAPTGAVLVVDRDATVCTLLERLLADACGVCVVHTAEAAMERIRTEPFDAVFIDPAVPGLSGDRIPTAIKAQDPALSTVLMAGLHTAHPGDRAGAFDFRIQKPFVDLSEVRQVAERAVELCRMRRETRRP